MRKEHQVGFQTPIPNEWDDYHWIIPIAVATENEGGHNGTVICLDCILEALKRL
jgi:hypothetical protein